MSGGQSTTVFRFGDFTFDCATRLLLRGRDERHLSPKAQQLLNILLAAQPRVVSREELYDALWPSTFVCDTNLASLVNELRRALGDDPRASQYIRTVHGFGYAFCGQVRPPLAGEFSLLVCAGRSYALFEGENVVGRSSDAGVVILDPAISRRHAVITVNHGTFTIHDLESKNGTFVDGRRVGRTPVAATVRSRIHLGVIEVSLQRRRISSTVSLEVNLGQLRRRVDEITVKTADHSSN